MNISRCKTCIFYEPFFSSCNLYDEEVYMGEGDFETRPISIRSVNKSECKYEKKAGV